MDYKTLIYEMTQLLKKAEASTNRKEAVDCIHKATKLQEAAELLKRNQGILA